MSLEQQLEEMSDFDGIYDGNIDAEVDGNIDGQCEEICSIEYGCSREAETIDDGSFRYADAVFVVKMMLFVAAAMVSMMTSAWLMMKLTGTQPSVTPLVQQPAQPPVQPILQEDVPIAAMPGIDKRTQTRHVSARLRDTEVYVVEGQRVGMLGVLVGVARTPKPLLVGSAHSNLACTQRGSRQRP